MRFLYVLAVSLVVVYAADNYSTGHADFDMAALVADVEKLAQFIGCYLDKNPCDETAAAFKKITPQVVREVCGKCSDVQKKMTKLFLDGVREKLPQEYEEFKKKFDPENKYMEALHKAVENA